ncbi:unnamed protein product (macronuclear) [Paramecium tetraurelia]|uniref:Transmembrane protein n=1 Tax=Paramecium tetraurelia TaxID=5888 RepID=A0DD15_PARTE|nr:uncharacterized protein GSPATT00015791001 [Paramecium tetraurelia]CAK80932.1 unnamed protein product [Paramecium tetraurelia]|eukprot:XP_001448329.1 hypothetical protein (macronuclear) [Paramecium tetraurelia strain d4-2]
MNKLEYFKKFDIKLFLTAQINIQHYNHQCPIPNNLSKRFNHSNNNIQLMITQGCTINVLIIILQAQLSESETLDIDNKIQLLENNRNCYYLSHKVYLEFKDQINKISQQSNCILKIIFLILSTQKQVIYISIIAYNCSYHKLYQLNNTKQNMGLQIQNSSIICFFDFMNNLKRKIYKCKVLIDQFTKIWKQQQLDVYYTSLSTAPSNNKVPTGVAKWKYNYMKEKDLDISSCQKSLFIFHYLKIVINVMALRCTDDYALNKDNIL